MLQGQSVEPCSNPKEYADYAHRFAELATQHHATPVLYVTWPRRAGSELYREKDLPHSVDAMSACLRDGASTAMMGTTMTVANVREPWMKVIAERPKLELYSADGSHPSVAGTYLAASVFLRVLAPSAQNPSWHPTGMSETDATYLGSLR